MKLRILAPLVGLFCLVLFVACTENERARFWGADMEIVLPCDQKLHSASWKDQELWYVLRGMHAGEQPDTYTYVGKESALFASAGTVTFIESHCSAEGG